MGLGMSGKVLYVCASVCIKERICMYRLTLRTKAGQSDIHSLANFAPIAEAQSAKDIMDT